MAGIMIMKRFNLGWILLNFIIGYSVLNAVYSWIVIQSELSGLLVMTLLFIFIGWKDVIILRDHHFYWKFVWYVCSLKWWWFCRINNSPLHSHVHSSIMDKHLERRYVSVPLPPAHPPAEPTNSWHTFLQKRWETNDARCANPVQPSSCWAHWRSVEWTENLKAPKTRFSWVLWWQWSLCNPLLICFQWLVMSVLSL